MNYLKGFFSLFLLFNGLITTLYAQEHDAWDDVVYAKPNHGINYYFDSNEWTVVAAKDYLQSFEATIYPNPIQEIIHMNVPLYEEVRYRLSNSLGEILKEEELSGNYTSLNLFGFPPGIYSLTLLNNKLTKFKTFKLIKL